jgi:hypothetical protein
LQEIGRLRLTITDLRVKLETADNRNTRNYYVDGYEYWAGYQAGMAEKKPWVGLTDEEVAKCWLISAVDLWKTIEAKLKEKNT